MKIKERLIKTNLGEMRVSECRATPSDEKTVIYVNGDPTKPGNDPARQLELIRACLAELPAIDPDKLKYSKQHDGFILAGHVGARIWIEHVKFAPRAQVTTTRGAKAA